jgi:hypothetical protein
MMRLFGSIALAASLLVVAGCHPAEGERCNPLLFNDECTNRLKCQTPPNCAVSYCCPQPDPTVSRNANCQACPSTDMAGSD